MQADTLMQPVIRKASRVTGNKLVFRDATPADAGFILGLRTDADKSRHLSSTPPSLSRQIEWLQGYQQAGDQAYFVIEDRNGKPVGTVRLYDAQGTSFCWGSWIKADGAPASFGMESALMVYRYGLHLGFQASHFDVRIGNQRVWEFHERLGARRVRSSDIDHFYVMDEQAIRQTLEQHAKYLPTGVQIDLA